MKLHFLDMEIQMESFEVKASGNNFKNDFRQSATKHAIEKMRQGTFRGDKKVLPRIALKNTYLISRIIATLRGQCPAPG